MDKTVTFALAKGRLAEKSAELLQKCGIDCANILEPTRKLVLNDKSGKYKINKEPVKKQVLFLLHK